MGVQGKGTLRQRKGTRMKVLDIAFVGYPVTDLKRARQLYEGVSGLQVTRLFGNGEVAFVE
jgi:hypothetical protein